MLGLCVLIFFFQAEDGIRDLVRSRGLGDVYKRQERSGEPSRTARVEAAPDAELPAAWLLAGILLGRALSLIHI